eukprot:g76184.t1
MLVKLPANSLDVLECLSPVSNPATVSGCKHLFQIINQNLPILKVAHRHDFLSISSKYSSRVIPVSLSLVLMVSYSSSPTTITRMREKIPRASTPDPKASSPAFTI